MRADPLRTFLSTFRRKPAHCPVNYKKPASTKTYEPPCNCVPSRADPSSSWVQHDSGFGWDSERFFFCFSVDLWSPKSLEPKGLFVKALTLKAHFYSWLRGFVAVWSLRCQVSRVFTAEWFHCETWLILFFFFWRGSRLCLGYAGTGAQVISLKTEWSDWILVWLELHSRTWSDLAAKLCSRNRLLVGRSAFRLCAQHTKKFKNLHQKSSLRSPDCMQSCRLSVPVALNALKLLKAAEGALTLEYLHRLGWIWVRRWWRMFSSWFARKTKLTGNMMQ